MPVSAPGIYLLTVLNTQNGCEADASVAVQADFVPPFASAGFDVLLNCFTPTGTLLGFGLRSGRIDYEWRSGGSVVGNDLSLPGRQQPEIIHLLSRIIPTVARLRIRWP